MTSHKLWEELDKQKKALEEQERRVFQACKALAEAVRAGQITDPEEINEVLIELLAGDHISAATWELYVKVLSYAKRTFPNDWSTRWMLEQMEPNIADNSDAEN